MVNKIRLSTLSFLFGIQFSFAAPFYIGNPLPSKQNQTALDQVANQKEEPKAAISKQERKDLLETIQPQKINEYRAASPVQPTPPEKDRKTKLQSVYEVSHVRFPLDQNSSVKIRQHGVTIRMSPLPEQTQKFIGFRVLIHLSKAKEGHPPIFSIHGSKRNDQWQVGFSNEAYKGDSVLIIEKPIKEGTTEVWMDISKSLIQSWGADPIKSMDLSSSGLVLDATLEFLHDPMKSQ